MKIPVYSRWDMGQTLTCKQSILRHPRHSNGNFLQLTLICQITEFHKTQNSLKLMEIMAHKEMSIIIGTEKFMRSCIRIWKEQQKGRRKKPVFQKNWEKTMPRRVTCYASFLCGMSIKEKYYIKHVVVPCVESVKFCTVNQLEKGIFGGSIKGILLIMQQYRIKKKS